MSPGHRARSGPARRRHRSTAHRRRLCTSASTFRSGSAKTPDTAPPAIGGRMRPFASRCATPTIGAGPEPAGAVVIQRPDARGFPPPVGECHRFEPVGLLVIACESARGRAGPQLAAAIRMQRPDIVGCATHPAGCRSRCRNGIDSHPSGTAALSPPAHKKPVRSSAKASGADAVCMSRIGAMVRMIVFAMDGQSIPLSAHAGAAQPRTGARTQALMDRRNTDMRGRE